jgi:hypothetical protein
MNRRGTPQRICVSDPGGERDWITNVSGLHEIALELMKLPDDEKDIVDEFNSAVRKLISIRRRVVNESPREIRADLTYVDQNILEQEAKLENLLAKMGESFRESVKECRDNKSVKKSYSSHMQDPNSQLLSTPYYHVWSRRPSFDNEFQQLALEPLDKLELLLFSRMDVVESMSQRRSHRSVAFERDFRICEIMRVNENVGQARIAEIANQDPRIIALGFGGKIGVQTVKDAKRREASR